MRCIVPTWPSARLCAWTAIAFLAAGLPAHGDAAQDRTPPKAPSPIERLGPDQLRVGNVRIDTAKKEVSVRGTVNDVLNLEFIATTKNGVKSYESAMELDTNAINFNLGLLLIGLDPARSVPSKQHFDPNPPQGDPVEIWVSWDEAGKPRRIRGEQVVLDRESKRTLPEGHWVYTGSVFVGDSNAYMADLDGALIGFVHTPSPVIENPRPVPGQYGNTILNPNLNWKPGTEVLLTVRALPRK